VAEGRFRQDLLYRINTVEIRLPPLRERVDDIPLLTQYYLDYFNQKYKRYLTITSDAMSALLAYQWPGNVRELAHVVERAVILSESETLEVTSLVGEPLDNIPAKQQVPELTEDKLNYQNSTEETFNLAVVEQRTVRAALKYHQGNVTKAAKALGLTRGAMYRRLEKYDL
jgi:transcriptional regulator with PAS, ATPase and Fis domain